MVITSISNQRVQELRRLADKKYRDESRLYVVEGVTLVRDMPSNLISSLFVRQSKYESLADYCSQFGDKLTVLDDKLFQRVSDTVNGSGLIAIAKRNNSQWDNSSNAIILDGLQDPGNVGTIIRTAVSAGIYNIVLSDCCDPFSPKAVRASMGGIFYANTFEVAAEKLQSFTHLLDYSILVFDMDGENIFKLQKPLRYALALGSEGHGVGQYVRNIATKTVGIPMSGKIESLNVAVSCGIGMYILQNL